MRPITTADPPRLRSTAPGRVNLIGDHTDYMGGLAMPMTIPMSTVIEGIRTPARIHLTSDAQDGVVDLTIPVIDPASVAPSWGRYIAGVAHLADPPLGVTGTVTSTIPVGAGLSSSAALTVASALILGVMDEPLDVAILCQAAENIATGVPSGIMDQLAIVASQPGCASLMDFSTLSVEAIPVPEDFRFWVIDSDQRRTLDGSEYATRRTECEQAAQLIGPLPDADPSEVDTITDPVLRSRARHVNSECQRVRDFAEAMKTNEVAAAGRLMTASHSSLRDDFDVSTDVLDRCVSELVDTPGVHGARLTGAGFGGCVVALADPGVELVGWPVQPSGHATLEIL